MGRRVSRIGYVLKVYPRFSETFVVTEILAREAHGDALAIYALRPTTDARFHPEIARVRAQVTWIPRPTKSSELWQVLAAALRNPGIRDRLGPIADVVETMPADEVAQGAALAHAVLDDGIDHLHAHFASLAGRVAWLASQLTGVPYTVTTHAKDIYHESVDASWLRRICGDADRVIAISRFNERHLHDILAGTNARVTMQHNALELARFPFREPCPLQQPLRVAAVGRLVPKKGFADLIAAAARLNEQGRDVRVDIAGAGELDAALRAQAEDAGLTGKVRLLGPCTQEEVRDLVQKAHVFVAPSVPAADGNIDGLPTVVLEAMATGTPVVATSVSGLPEVIDDGVTGVLLPPGDVSALVDALTRFADGRVDAPALARAARQLVEERFDSRKQAAALSSWQSAHGRP